MIRHTHLLTTLLSVLLACMTLQSCRDEGTDGPVDMTCTDIVTFSGNSGGNAVFTFQKVDDSPEITLTATGNINTDQIEEGSRLLIRYIPESNKAYTSGHVTLLSGYKITQSDIASEWKDDYNRWDRDKVYLYSAWRSGNYLNLHVRLTYSPEPRIFRLVADPGTLSTSCPDVYLVHVMDNATDNHDRAYYASFDLTPLWSRPEVEGIRLHVANINLDKQIFTFQKSR